jgi:hypothetical protein
MSLTKTSMAHRRWPVPDRTSFKPRRRRTVTGFAAEDAPGE